MSNVKVFIVDAKGAKGFLRGGLSFKHGQTVRFDKTVVAKTAWIQEAIKRGQLVEVEAPSPKKASKPKAKAAPKTEPKPEPVVEKAPEPAPEPTPEPVAEEPKVEEEKEKAPRKSRRKKKAEDAPKVSGPTGETGEGSESEGSE